VVWWWNLRFSTAIALICCCEAKEAISIEDYCWRRRRRDCLLTTPTTISWLFGNQFFYQRMLTGNTHEVKKEPLKRKENTAFSFTSLSRPVLPRSDSGEGVAMLEPWHLK
jgi:hypothetical protein